MSPKSEPAPKRSSCLGRLFLISVVLAVVGSGALYYFSPSTLLKMLPAPEAESIVISGRDGFHLIIDGKGGWYNDGKPTELIIQSAKTPNGWERPEGITIRNCRIRGSIRIMGLGKNGEAKEVKQSSLSPGHTQRAQNAAPTDILISGVTIEADHRIPLYLAPGVTNVTIENCHITGWSASTGLYLDAESADNIIRDNTFSLRTSREVIAVDGSARNRIERNRFDQIPHGGIYLYRNCGEGGTIRHQKPQGNLIAYNHFSTGSLGSQAHPIWIGSRNGGRLYCDDDAGKDFGSSIDNRDFANNNTLMVNRFDPPTTSAIRDDGTNNRIIWE
jgi:hypothetical protein